MSDDNPNFAPGRQPVSNSCLDGKQGHMSHEGHTAPDHANCPCTVWPNSLLAKAMGCECECHDGNA